MSLVFTSKSAPAGLGGMSFEAYDGDKRVVVIITHEALQDCDLASIREAARKKYALRQIEADGSVRVTSSDCRAFGR